MQARRYLLSGVAALYFGTLVGFALLPEWLASRHAWMWPMLAFIPVGVFLLLLVERRRWWAAIAFGALGAAWLEAAQSIWMPVGYAAATDVIWASVGSTIGVVVTLAILCSRRRTVHSQTFHRNVAQTRVREIPQD